MSLTKYLPPPSDQAVMGIESIAFVGDVHGRLDCLIDCVRTAAFHERGTIVQVGDFWMYQDQRILTKFERQMGIIENQYGVPIDVHFIDGNHEDYSKIDPHGDVPHQFSPRMTYHPRGTVFDVHGVSIGCFGGAHSHDVAADPAMNWKGRREGKDWWPNEAPQPHDVEKAVNMGHVDILVTHEAPMSTFDIIRADDTTPQEVSSRKDVQSVLDATTPYWMFHGHHHTPYTTMRGFTRITGLACNAEEGSVAAIFYGDGVEFLM